MVHWLCPNHSSNWDPILVVLRLPIHYRVHIRAKEELFRNPVLPGFFARWGHSLSVVGSNDIETVRTAMQSIKSGDNLLIFPEGTVIRNGIGYVDGLPPRARGGSGGDRRADRSYPDPGFCGWGEEAVPPDRIIFGKPYEPHYTGRRGTSEEMQKIADDLLEEAYALGGQAVGGAPLCGK